MSRLGLRRIIGFILAVFLLTSILFLAGTTAGQRRFNTRNAKHSAKVAKQQKRVISFRPSSLVQPKREVQPIRPFHAFGTFGRTYHPFWDPYGRHDHYTFYRRSF